MDGGADPEEAGSRKGEAPRKRHEDPPVGDVTLGAPEAERKADHGPSWTVFGEAERSMTKLSWGKNVVSKSSLQESGQSADTPDACHMSTQQLLQLVPSPAGLEMRTFRERPVVGKVVNTTI